MLVEELQMALQLKCMQAASQVGGRPRSTSRLGLAGRD
jgi:hypothetical protein